MHWVYINEYAPKVPICSMLIICFYDHKTNWYSLWPYVPSQVSECGFKLFVLYQGRRVVLGGPVKKVAKNIKYHSVYMYTWYNGN